MTKRAIGLVALLAALALIVAGCGKSSSDSGSGGGGGGGGEEASNVAFLPKLVNISYFNATDQGAKEAAKELGGKYKQVGPSEATAAAQLPFIDNLSSQKVGVIAVAGNDANALAPALKRAAERGSKVIAFDSDVRKDARTVFLNQADSKEIAKAMLDSVGGQIGYKGEIAILSSTTTATNQNTWIKFMKEYLKEDKYSGMELVKIAYGEEDEQKNRQEMRGLIQAYPDLKGVIVPAAVGLPAAARAVGSRGGELAVTGLALPNDMRKFVKSGVTKEVVLWSPVDLGYLTYYAADALSKGQITGKEGEKFKAGRLGEYTIGKDGEVVLGPPLVFTKDNIDKYKF